MKNKDVDETALVDGLYCRKQHPGCFCNVGWPVERQCERCAESEPRMDFCRNGGCCWAPKEWEDDKFPKSQWDRIQLARNIQGN